jgi:hypothetical protein
VATISNARVIDGSINDDGFASEEDHLAGVTVDLSLANLVRPHAGYTALPGCLQALKCPWHCCRSRCCGPAGIWLNPDVTALVLDNVAAAAILIGGGVYLSAALQQQAQHAAGCSDFELFCGQSTSRAEYSSLCGLGRFNTSAPNAPNAALVPPPGGCADCPEFCGKRIYGFVAANYITLNAAIAAITAALVMPVIGSMVDFTHKRRQVGLVTAWLLVALNVLQGAFLHSSWLFTWVLKIVEVRTL